MARFYPSLKESRFFLTVASDSSGDYANIQSALDAIPNSGGTIFVRGTHTITSPLLIKKSSTEIICSADAVIQCDGSIVATLIKPDTTSLSRIRIKGGKWLQTNATTQGTAFDFSDSSNCVITPTRIENFNLAVKLYDTVNTTFYNRYADIQIFDCNNGIQTGGTQANNNLFESIRIRPKAGGAGKGIDIVDARGLTFINVDIEPATATGITGISVDTTSREITFINCWVENNAVGVSIASGANRITFLGGSITGNTNDVSDSGTSTVFLNTNKTGTRLHQTQTHSRWIKPYHAGVGSTSQVATAGTVVLSLFEVNEDCVVDAINWVNAATVAGNVRVGIYGPISTEETATGAALLYDSGDIVQSGTNTTQQHILSTPKVLRRGRYYVAIEFSDGTATYMRQANQRQVTGWGATYARSGGYGALTDPSPTVTETGSGIPAIYLRTQV
jgi:hypothetical protein